MATETTEDEMLAAAQQKLEKLRAEQGSRSGESGSRLTLPGQNPIEPRGACMGCKGELQAGRLFICEACEGLAEKEKTRRADVAAAEACEARLKRSNLPGDYALLFRNRTHLRKPHVALLEQAKVAPSVYMHGPAGAGKTSIACVLLAELIRAGSQGMYVVVPDLMSDLRVIYGAADSRSSSTLIDPLIEAPLLVLDDIGKEKPSEHTATVLFELLDGRYRRRRQGRWTAILSNYAADEIGARFNDPELADPLVRRMTDGAKVITVR